jgi:hypothetical protein
LPVDVHQVVWSSWRIVASRAAFLAWLLEQRIDSVVHITTGTGLVTIDGCRWRLGTEGLWVSEIPWAPQVGYGQRHHCRSRNPWINVALCWRLPRHAQRPHPSQQAEEPWYLATSQSTAQWAVAWYRRRCWIGVSCKDSKSRFQLKHVRIGAPKRLTRLLLALTIAQCWLALTSLPEGSALPPRWHASAVQWGRASFLNLGLALLDALQDRPLP